MVIQLNIEDERLAGKISEYIDAKHKAVNELMMFKVILKSYEIMLGNKKR